MDFLNRRDAFLVIFFLTGLDLSEGAVTLTQSPNGATVGDEVTVTCTSTANIRNVTWKINGGNEEYFDPSLSQRVFGNVFRGFTISTTSTQYNLRFNTYSFDIGATWQCFDDGMSSNIITLFGSVATATTAAPGNGAGSGSGSVAATSTSIDDNLALIAGLCAMGGLVFIILTVMLCWCLGRRRETYTQKVRTVREPAPVQYVQEPAPVQYVQEPAPVQYVTQPAPVQYVTQPAPVQYVTQPAPAPVQYIREAQPAQRTVYQVRDEQPRRTVVLANNPVTYVERSSDVYDPYRFTRRSIVSTGRSDNSRSSNRFVGVVYDSYEGRDSEELYSSSDVYAKVVKRPNLGYM